MTTRPTSEERITELEDELAAARRTIDVLIARLERTGTTPPNQSELFDSAVQIANVLEERSREVEDARAEFRALRSNLDMIVRQRTRALAESEAQLREKNAELERQAKSKTEFISIAAHELRTPLTSIVGYLDLFTEGRFGELPALLVRPMSAVQRNAHRLKRLVNDMLDVSRLEAGKITLRPEQVNLGDVVNAVVTELAPIASGRHVETHIGPVAAIDADRDKLHQITMNLVHNAIRYTPEQGEILIDVDEAPSERYPGGWVRLRVRDNGSGIAEEDRPRIFDPFLHAKSHPAKHHTSALPDPAGLGLFIARGLVELHGGLITVDSKPDEFTEFTVLLPFKNHRGEAGDPAAGAGPASG